MVLGVVTRREEEDLPAHPCTLLVACVHLLAKTCILVTSMSCSKYKDRPLSTSVTALTFEHAMCIIPGTWYVCTAVVPSVQALYLSLEHAYSTYWARRSGIPGTVYYVL